MLWPETRNYSIIKQITLDEQQNIANNLLSHFLSKQKELKKDDSSVVYETSEALGYLGNIAVEPLIEIFKLTEKFYLSRDGNIAFDTYEFWRGHTCGSPAANLIDAAGGPSNLKKILDPDLYEKILIYGHNRSKYNAVAEKAISEIGSKRSISYLVSKEIYILRQTHWGKKIRQAAIEKLASIGKAAYPKLFEHLNLTIRGGYEAWKVQTCFRKDILKVLELSGDMNCVDKIVEVAKYDKSIAIAANKTLSAIAQRDHKDSR